jgi:hypothetical protein
MGFGMGLGKTVEIPPCRGASVFCWMAGFGIVPRSLGDSDDPMRRAVPGSPSTRAALAAIARPTETYALSAGPTLTTWAVRVAVCER